MEWTVIEKQNLIVEKLVEDGWVLHDGVYSTLLKIKDYGKTWALTKEELK